MKQKQLIAALLKMLEHLLDENQRMKNTIDRYRGRDNKSFHRSTQPLGKFTEVEWGSIYEINKHRMGGAPY